MKGIDMTERDLNVMEKDLHVMQGVDHPTG